MTLDTKHSAWHAIQFYRQGDDAVLAASGLAREALDEGKVVIHLARRLRNESFLTWLMDSGFDVDAARKRIVLRDAEDLVAKFVRHGEVDAYAFDREVGVLVCDWAAKGRRVHIYGELADLLWSRGNVRGALAIEGLWNELLAKTEFTLHCPVLADDEGLRESVPAILERHSHLVRSYVTRWGEEGYDANVVVVDALRDSVPPRGSAFPDGVPAA